MKTIYDRLFEFVERCAYGDHPDEIPEDAQELLTSIEDQQREDGGL